MSSVMEVMREEGGKLPQVVMPTRHFLVDGMYLRQIRIPAGTAFLGRRHRKLHYFMVLAGGAWVTGDDGIKHNLKPGMVFMCPAGSQRVGITYADTIFATVHRTDELDLKAIEDDCVEFDIRHTYGVGNQILERLE